MRKQILAFSIFALIFAVSMAFVESSDETRIKRSILTISIVSIKENTKLVEIKAEYPQINHADDSFNQKIESLVETSIEDFKEISEENWQARKENSGPDENLGEYPENPFYFEMLWSPAQLNGKYVSFAMRLAAYEGGANMRQEIFAFNYDISEKKEITLADLSKGDPDYLKKISDFAIKDLESELSSDENIDFLKGMIKDGAGPKEGNFRNFTFTDKLIKIYFQKYQVMPGVFGEQEVSVSRTIFDR